MTLLETFTPAFGLNVYAGFNRGANDIAFLQVRGDGFALDDLQFTPVPEPNMLLIVTVMLIALPLRRGRTWRSCSQSFPRNRP
jgi:hypothetical protein